MDTEGFRIALVKGKTTARKVALAAGMSPQALYSKMDGRREFRSSEIKKISSILGLTMQDVNRIFFDDCVN